MYSTISSGTNINEQERQHLALTFGLVSAIGATISFTVLCLMLFLNFASKTKTRIIIYLFISDFTQGLAGSFTLFWLSNAPQPGNVICIIQGWLGTFTVNATALWNGLVAVYVLLIMVSKTNRPRLKFEICSHMIWIISFVLACVGLIKHSPSNFYGPVGHGGWCWISPNIAAAIFYVYSSVTLVMVTLFFVYFLIGIYLYQKAKLIESVALWRIFGHLAGFPLIYFILFFPLTIVRLVSVLGKPLPVQYEYIGICFMGCYPVMNAILYGYSRKVFSRFMDKMRGYESLDKKTHSLN